MSAKKQIPHFATVEDVIEGTDQLRVDILDEGAGPEQADMTERIINIKVKRAKTSKKRKVKKSAKK